MASSRVICLLYIKNTVTWWLFLANASQTEDSTDKRASVVDRTFRKPYYTGVKELLLSKNHISLAFTLFSSTLQRHDLKETGQYLVVCKGSFPGIEMEITTTTLQEEGKPQHSI